MLEHAAKFTDLFDGPDGVAVAFGIFVSEGAKSAISGAWRMRNHRSSARPVPRIAILVPNVDGRKLLIDAVAPREENRDWNAHAPSSSSSTWRVSSAAVWRPRRILCTTRSMVTACEYISCTVSSLSASVATM